MQLLSARPSVRTSRWLIVVDLYVLGVLAVIVSVDGSAALFKIPFYLLTIAAFFWGTTAWRQRAIFWGLLTSGVVVWAVATDRAPFVELVDIAYFVAVLALVFTVTTQRNESARRIEELLEAERARTTHLESLAELKAGFTSMIVHEFGNPLAALRRLNEMMSVEGLDPAMRDRTLASIRTEIGVLEKLIVDVSSTVDVERDDFRVEMTDVAFDDLAAETESFGRSICGPRSFVVHTGPGLAGRTVWADPGRLGQVMRNLVSNAVKYTPPGSRLGVRFTATTDERLRVEVSDDGPGVNAAEIDQIFEKYYRASGVIESTAPGMGLGLFICRRILDSHGAELAVASTPGVGSTFSFELPLARQPQLMGGTR